MTPITFRDIISYWMILRTFTYFSENKEVIKMAHKAKDCW
jgi:hypothetical protein